MILKHLGHNRRKEHGFTMVELLVAMAMTAVVMAAVYTLYKTQQDSYIAQKCSKTSGPHSIRWRET
jgi:prepilin-type N-terminal cleavage/methylation domain-containing protein